MKHVSSDERIAAWLDRVCGRLRWPPYRTRVRRELTDHILSRAEYLQNERGFTEEEAVLQAVSMLGDPEALGDALRRTHRTIRRVCFLLLACMIWAGIAVCVIYLLLHLPF